MYEAYYDLEKRPFAATPDVDATVETPAVAEIISRLDRCVRQGRGIGVLTAGGGLGKTQLCHRLARLWQDEFQVTLLPNAGFPSGRGLLQAILAELDQPYQGLMETALRIEIKSLAQAIRNASAGLVLILDDAHRGSDRLLDEIRLLSNLIDAGEPLVRIVIAGRLELEDRLSDPALAGMNERIGELVSIPRLTAEESRHYLEQRSLRAGRDLDLLFDDDAVAMLVRVCGGVPRCLNQLADHCLLLGYVAERRRIDATLVREALEDLKRLPLQWHDPAPSAIVDDDVDSNAFRNGDNETSEWVIEIGSLADDDHDDFTPVDTDPADGESLDEGSLGDRETSPTRVTPFETIAEVCSFAAETAENAGRPALEPICDRFARLDASEARRRWLEELERENASLGNLDHPDAATTTAAGRQTDSVCESQSTAASHFVGVGNPLPLIETLEAIVADETASDRRVVSEADCDHPDRDGRSAFDQVCHVHDTRAENRTMRLPVEAGRQRRRDAVRKTTFSDLRRRRTGRETK